MTLQSWCMYVCMYVCFYKRRVTQSNLVKLNGGENKNKSKTMNVEEKVWGAG